MQNTLVSFLFLYQRDFPSSTFVPLHLMLGISEGRFILQKRGILTDNKAVLLYFFVLRGIETFIFMKSNGSPKTF